MCVQTPGAHEQLLGRLLTVEEHVAAVSSWQAQRSAAQVEDAAAWLPAPAPTTHALTPTPTPAPTHAQPVSSGGRKRKGSSSSLHPTPVASTGPAGSAQDLMLPPAVGYVRVCDLDLPSKAARMGVSLGGVGRARAAAHAFVTTASVSKNMKSSALALAGNR